MKLEDLTLEELYKLKRELLYHVVGMPYNMQVEQIRHFLKKRKCFLFDYKIVYER